MDVRPDNLPRTIAERTRRVYDRMSFLYPISTQLFHSRAHRCALEMSGIRDGMRVLEVATGSGEMFRRLVRANPTGETIGLDLSPNMAALTHKRIRREFPRARTLCKAVDARFMPFRDECFDLIVCCYLLELLGADDISRTLSEFHRVLRSRGRLALVLIGEDAEFFNRAYKVCGKVAPAFWGRQVERGAAELIQRASFRISSDRTVRQGFYPSRVLVAHK
ncbi:MAG: class I SAM-dependent methyltransferase [Bryobacteraceae bacterium]